MLIDPFSVSNQCHSFDFAFIFHQVFGVFNCQLSQQCQNSLLSDEVVHFSKSLSDYISEVSFAHDFSKQSSLEDIVNRLFGNILVSSTITHTEFHVVFPWFIAYSIVSSFLYYFHDQAHLHSSDFHNEVYNITSSVCCGKRFLDTRTITEGRSKYFMVSEFVLVKSLLSLKNPKQLNSSITQSLGLNKSTPLFLPTKPNTSHSNFLLRSKSESVLPHLPTLSTPRYSVPMNSLTSRSSRTEAIPRSQSLRQLVTAQSARMRRNLEGSRPSQTTFTGQFVNSFGS
ncbi:hypothetical protein RCL1_008290 [Eukaryota sp. TZLM3-RCL]